MVTARDATAHITEPNKISKPILMCFICKLSFGNTKSFGLHASSEHALNLQECEKMLLSREYSSAIIQRNGDEKPQISFLEPLDVHKSTNAAHQNHSTAAQLSAIQQQHVLGFGHNNQTSTTTVTAANTGSASDFLAIKSHGSTSTTNNTQHTPTNTISTNDYQANSGLSISTALAPITTTSASCTPSTSPTNSIVTTNPTTNLDLTGSNSKLLSELFLQQQHHQFQQQQHLQHQLHHHHHSSHPSQQCPEHIGTKGIDCKTCEMMNVSIKSPNTPTKSPNSLSQHMQSPPGSTTSLNMSPTTPAPSFTIGACPEHINGRPIGIDCPRYVVDPFSNVTDLCPTPPTKCCPISDQFSTNFKPISNHSQSDS